MKSYNILYILLYFIFHYILNGLVLITSADAHTHPASHMNSTTSAVMMGNNSILMRKFSPVLPNVLPNGQGRVSHHPLASVVSKLQSVLFPHTPLLDEASAGCCHANEIVSLRVERGSSLFLFFLQHRLLNDRPHGNAGLISGCRLGEVTDGAQHASDCV